MSISQTAINNQQTPKKPNLYKKLSLWFLIAIVSIIGLWFLLFFVVSLLGPYSPLLMFTQKEEYRATTIEQLEKDPGFSGPAEKVLKSLKFAESIDGASKVEYIYRPSRGDSSESFNISITFDKEVTEDEFKTKISEAVQKNGGSVKFGDFIGIGSFCIDSKYASIIAPGFPKKTAIIDSYLTDQSQYCT